MAKLIFISPYMKGGRDAARLAHRTRYFATREGVQLLKDDNAHLPATKKQQKYIQRLLRSFPEAKELPEHEDYANTPNRQTAFDLIEQIHEDFVVPMDSRENYLDYVANRPGVKSLGEHGLWNVDGKVISLENAVAEVAQHQGNVWTPIISLSRENAERLGYTDIENWQALINASITDIAKGYKIHPDHLRWYAALHEKEKHLHVHMVIFSTAPKEGFLTKQGIRSIKSALVSTIYRNERLHIYEQKDHQRSMVQDLLEPSKVRGKSQFQVLMDKLPSEHKARWLAGAALNSSEQAMASVMSTVLSRLNSFLDSELEQILCFDSAIDAEMFAAEKSAIFLILPEEDTTKNFMAGLMIQNLSRELFAVADENGGKLKNRVILFCDELGTMPPFDILPLFSAGRSRRLTLVPIIQSMAQLEKNYGREGASILMDNCQDVISGGFAPNSEAAETFSKALGSRTVLSGTVSRGKNDPSQSLQMMERPLLTADELKSIPKGSFIVQKTGCHPMRTRLRLFLEWGITFDEEYRVAEQSARKVYYADREALTRAILKKYPPRLPEQQSKRSSKSAGQMHDSPMQDMIIAEDIDYAHQPKRHAYNLPHQEDTP